MAEVERVVVVAVDESDHAKKAFEWFLDNIYRKEDLVVLAHIPESPHLKTFSFKHGINLPVEEWKKLLEDQLEKVRKLEVDYEGTMVAKKIKYKMKGEACKNPGEGIIGVVESENANLVVMGTRGLDPLRRTLLGSVSDYVVRHSKVPVLVCPK